MKRMLPCLWIVLSTTGLFAQSASTSISNQAWYKVMTGYIDKYRASAYLFYRGGTVTGYLYYKTDGQPTAVTGTLRGSKMDLFTAGDDKTKESFVGSFSGTTLKGVWILSGTRKTFLLNYFKKDPHFLALNYVWVSGSRKLQGRPNHPPRNLIYSASSVWPVDSSAQSQFLKNELFGILNISQPKSNSIVKELKKNMSAYLTDQGTPDEDEAGKEHDAHVTVIYNDPHILSLDLSFYDYNGGAHGQGGHTYFAYEIQTHTHIHLIEVLDTLRFRAEISRELEAQYRIDHQLPDGVPLSTAGADRGVNLFDDHIPLTTNFYLTPDGIGFSYLPYELAPYAQGSIDIFLPYREVSLYLQPRFKEWMHLK